MPDGMFYDIEPGKGCPIWQGLEIQFKNGMITASVEP